MLDPDELDECFHQEEAALAKQLDQGLITREYYDQELRSLRHDLAQQKYEWEMKDAGR